MLSGSGSVSGCALSFVAALQAERLKNSTRWKTIIIAGLCGVIIIVAVLFLLAMLHVIHVR
jgi:hypothetical protein